MRPTDKITEGRIEDMPAFFAHLQHVYTSLISAPNNTTPIMLIAQPVWTAKNHEDITQFVFETFRTPAFCMMDSALATTYAFGIPNATIIDVGFGKVDVTAITDFQISGRGNVPGSGGEAMTQSLMKLLKAKNFTWDMAEKLKMSPICEVLAPGTPLPGSEEVAEVVSNPAAAASTGAVSSGPNVRITEPPPHVEDDEGLPEESMIEDDGVLDIARLVTSGKTKEYLAKMEKEKADKAEKAEKAANRKAAKDAKEAAEAAAAKPTRLPNAKRPRAMFHYEESIQEGPDSKRQKTPTPEPTAVPEEAAADTEETKPDEPRLDEPKPDDSTLDESKLDESKLDEPKPEDAAAGDAPVVIGAARREQEKAARKEAERVALETEHGRVRRGIEIGVERFQAASEGYIDAIADAVYRTIHSVDDVGKRQDAWDALVICGSGSKVKGFKDALLATLNNRYLISPSSATMFVSELPSNLATPSGTGSMTPNASFSGTPGLSMPTASQVNPLLLAATTASNPALNPGSSMASQYGSLNHSHSSHSQSPTSIKVVSPPTYFPEWKFYEEAVFVGSQVAAKVVFVVDNVAAGGKGFLTKTDFNDEGPSAIHQV